MNQSILHSVDSMELLLIPLLLGAFLVVIYTLINGIGPTPTNRRVMQQLREVIPERITGTVVELGAGWGGVSVFLARQYPDNTVVAVENCPPVWLICWLRAILSRVPNLTVKLGDIHQEELSEAGLIYCYLFPGAMKKLLTRLQSMPPGKVIISNTFSLPGLQPEETCQADDFWKSNIYRYRLSQ